MNTTGKVIGLPVNSYKVLEYPLKNIHQYDIIIGNGQEKRIVNNKVWYSNARKQATGPAFVYDGNKLAWSLDDFTEKRVMVDLDVEEGKPPSKNGRNAFKVQIMKTKTLDISVINAYLNNRIQFGVNVGEAISFLDHLLREGPSQNPNMVAVKRSFFIRNGEKMDLGGGIEVFRGVYQSMRLAQGGKMVVNLDVANTCFWKPGALVNLIIAKNRFRDAGQLAQAFSNPASTKATEKYLSKLTVKASYVGNKMPDKTWKIKGIAKETANTRRLTWRDAQGNDTNEKITVAAYFKRKYNVQLRLPDLPLIETTKKDVHFPIEVLIVIENQRYGSKLDETQTAAMIKFAVSPPGVRSKAIDEGKSWLNWGTDRYLANFGLRIDPNKIVTQARILPPPGVRFGKGKIEQPGTKGRWDLRSKTFLTGNPQQLVSWGIGMFGGRTRLDKSQIEKFALDFAKAYRGHGGVVANGLPYITQLPNDAAAAVQTLFTETGNNFKMRPQILIIIVQDRNSQNYLRIKKSCDIRFGVVSQVMQAAQVAKGNPQYYSNVLMKFNAKLGGCTSAAVPAPTSGFKMFTAPTMFIGADVSHASPGSEQASMAALTVSFDKHAGRYAAACQTNGKRVEMISETNMREMLGPMTQQWSAQVGGGNLPQQIYYMRDGVSEGQFAHVIQQEVPHIRAVMTNIANGKGWNGKITVVIASKRHHIRAFPRQADGDQKGNPVPGTLIENDVTMPNEWDFYLYSHIALQGTSRPVHYTVIMDEANHSPNVLQNMIYEHCYQYMRSTTSVSLHPAVYYAHLASNRAKAHEDVAASAGPQGGAGFKQNQPPSSDASTSEVAPLMPMINSGGIRYSMWYI